MPQVDLAKMSGPELRRLLDATRERGQAALTYQILKEMAARRERGGRPGLFPMGRQPEPRVISVDLGDPMEPKDEPPPAPAQRPRPGELEDDALAAPPAPPEPVSPPARRRSRSPKSAPAAIVAPVAADQVRVDDLEETSAPQTEQPSTADPELDRGRGEPFLGLESLPAPGRRRFTPAAAFALGGAAGVAIGWLLAGIGREAPSVPAAPASARVMTVTGERPANQIVAAPLPGREPGPPSPKVAHSAAAEPPHSPRGRGDAEVVRTVETPEVARTRAPAVGPDACTAEPTPADRVICGDPKLRRLQRELRLAYADALKAHKDRALLRQRQLAWRDARNPVADPDRLAQAYEQRIRRLKSATADARRR